jgi:hypothetical protein
MDGNFLPQDNIVGKTKDKIVFDSPDWVSAKTACDSAAAERVVEKLWKPGKSEALVGKLPRKSRDLAVISQPSTTRLNVLAIELAKKLAGDLHADCYLGDDFYNALHNQQSKHIPRLQRPFNPREYVAVDPHRVTQILGGKTVIVAEDVLTTGSSVKQFVKALQRDGVTVFAVAALLGDRRLAVDEKTRDALIDAVRENGINLSIGETQQLADLLTRTEARNIALLINNVRTENGKESLTRKLQGLLNQGIAPDLGGVADQGRDEGFQGEDRGHDGPSQRIQAWHIPDPTAGPGKQLGPVPPQTKKPQRTIFTDPPNLPALDREFFSDQRLTVQQTDMRFVHRVSGRLVGTGFDEQNAKPYILVESADGTVHCIHQSPEAMKARAAGLKIGNFIELTSTPFVADDGVERVRVKFRSLGNSHSLLGNKMFLAQEVQRTLETTGTLPTDQGFGGWLGDYQRALCSTAEDLMHRGVIQARGNEACHFATSLLLEHQNPALRESGKSPHLTR